MKLKELIELIDNKQALEPEQFIELEKRIKQVKAFYNENNFEVVIELVSNIIQLFYVCINIDAYDMLELHELNNLVETGHVNIIEL